MYNEPTLTHAFSVTDFGNTWSMHMCGKFTIALISIDINYVQKELICEIMNTADTTIQDCVDDIISNGIRHFTVNIDGPSSEEPAQRINFSGITALHHSLRFKYSEISVATHYLVLNYIDKEIIGG